MSEQFSNRERNDESNQSDGKWDSLSDIPFNAIEAQETGRTELEQQTIDKLNQNHNAKKTFQKIILGVTMAAVLAGGAIGILNSSEQRGEAHPISVTEAVDSADEFVDRDSEDLVWFEEITDDTGLTVEYSQHFRDQNQSYDRTLQGDVAQIEIDWWEGRGPMYRATDQDADGKWDVVQKYNIYTDELSTIDLNELDDLNTDSLTMSGVEQLFD